MRPNRVRDTQMKYDASRKISISVNICQRKLKLKTWVQVGIKSRIKIKKSRSRQSFENRKFQNSITAEIRDITIKLGG